MLPLAPLPNFRKVNNKYFLTSQHSNLTIKHLALHPKSYEMEFEPFPAFSQGREWKALKTINHSDTSTNGEP